MQVTCPLDCLDQAAYEGVLVLRGFAVESAIAWMSRGGRRTCVNDCSCGIRMSERSITSGAQLPSTRQSQWRGDQVRTEKERKFVGEGVVLFCSSLLARLTGVGRSRDCELLDGFGSCECSGRAQHVASPLLCSSARCPRRDVPLSHDVVWDNRF